MRHKIRLRPHPVVPDVTVADALITRSPAPPAQAVRVCAECQTAPVVYRGLDANGLSLYDCPNGHITHSIERPL